MGTLVRITVYTPDEQTAKAAFRAAFDRIRDLDNILSDYKPDSELNRITKTAVDRAVPVSEDLFTVLRASQDLAAATGGAFDITQAPVIRLWREARRTGRLPDAAALRDAAARAGFRMLHLDAQRRTVRFDITGMALDVGGIGKGYAASEAIEAIGALGVPSALVAVSGDLAFSGAPPGERGWRIGVHSGDPAVVGVPAALELTNGAVSTAGGSEQHVEIGGRRYSHIIDSSTGMGLVDDITVTVVAPHGLEADGLDTAASVLGAERGLALIESRPEAAALIIERTSTGTNVRQSSKFAQLLRGGAPPALLATSIAAQGGRGSAAATKFNEVCAACHGISAAKGPTAPSLFDDEWLHGSDDESIVKNIRDGLPEKGMQPFRDVLTEQETWQMVAYIRTTAANLKEKPVYVPDPDGQIVSSQKQTFRMEVVARNLETPWGMAFLPDGRMLITERPGRLRIVQNGKLLPEPVKGTPRVWEKQDGGLLDVEVHPDYARNGNGWIYISYSETLANPAGAGPGCPGRGGAPADPPSMTVVARGRINTNNEWVDQQILYRAPDNIYNSCNAHYGSRFIFDRQNHLFFSLGEKQQIADAQDLTKPTGKIHRINDDGTVPRDNPFAGRTTVVANTVPTIWSVGHRNPQGFAWDPVTGQLWASEHGPTGGDEINIVEPTKNYGWGVITMGVQNGITRRSAPGMEQPIRYWTPSVAPSGIAFYTGTRYPGWKNNLFVSCLVGQQLKRLEIANGKVTHEEAVFNQFGRVHDVVQGPDGLLYVTLQLPGQVLSQSTPGMIARLVPVTR